MINQINDITKRFEEQIKQLESLFNNAQSDFNKQVNKLPSEQQAFFKDALQKAKSGKLTIQDFEKVLSKKINEWR